MNASAISALAALVGAAIGGLTSVLASWLTQHTQARVQLLTHEYVRRQELYKEFIERAAKCYADALQHDEPDMPGLIELYAKMARIRVLSSPNVVEIAEDVGRKIFDTYLPPNNTFPKLREMVNDKSSGLFPHFSRACRSEFESLRAQQF